MAADWLAVCTLPLRSEHRFCYTLKVVFYLDAKKASSRYVLFAPMGFERLGCGLKDRK